MEIFFYDKAGSPYENTGFPFSWFLNGNRDDCLQKKKYQIKSYKNKQAELLYEHKDFSLFCFLMKKSPKEISVFLTAQNLFQNLIEPFFRKFFVKRCMSAFLQYLQTIRNTQTVQRIDDAL